MNIFKPTSVFDFSKITLAKPKPLQVSGTYLTNIKIDGDKPFYVQLPKCTTKQGIVSSQRDKYCDLMYEQCANIELMDWIEKFEKTCHDKIMENKNIWFNTELSRDDIETMMTPLVRVYKSNKYILLRAYISANKVIGGKDSCMIYDENEEIIEMNRIDVDKTIIPLVIIDGIRFNEKSFEVDVRLVQIMVFNNTSLLPNCLIKIKTTQIQENNEPTSLADVGESSAPELRIASESATAPRPALELELELEQSILSPEYINSSGVLATSEQLAEMPIGYKKDHSEIVVNTDINNTSPPPPPPPPGLGIEEIILDYSNISDTVKIKKPNEIYYKIYIAARKKAKYLRKIAMEAFLEAKDIKTSYMLDDVYISDDENVNDNEQ
jgi:hypothetical protein